ncbi:phosphatase PAP2 family protein [Calditrichota bacterium]
MKGCITLLILIFLVTNLCAQDEQFPYELNNRDFILLPAGIGLSLISESLVDQVDPITLEEIRILDRNEVFGLDRCATNYWSEKWSDVSDQYRDILVYPTLLSFIPPMLQGEFYNSVVIATMVAESYFLLRGFTYLTKVAILRKRPYLYNSNYSAEERFQNDADDLFSFYSGHTAVAFFTATFLSKVATDIYGNNLATNILWGSSLAVASLTGYARIRAGKHFPTDVIAGAAVGFAIGYLVPMSHHKEMEDRFSIILLNNQMGLAYHF